MLGLEHTPLSVAGNAGCELEMEDLQERQNILLCLRMIGSSVAWCSGIRSSLVLPDFSGIASGLEWFPGHQGPDSIENDYRSRLLLIQIESEVFTLASSAASAAEKPQEIQDGICVLRQRMEDWIESNDEFAKTTGNEPTSRTEHAICLRTLRVLMAWGVADATQDAHTAILDHSRSCLKLFAGALRADCDLGVHANLTR